MAQFAGQQTHFIHVGRKVCWQIWEKMTCLTRRGFGARKEDQLLGEYENIVPGENT